MPFKPRPLRDQVIVITGASSGIGLVTARRAAERGAKVVLAARNEDALHDIVDDINADVGQAVAVTADVADERAVRRIAREALDHFGRIDTWVNNAGVSIAGRIDEIPTADSRRLFETNFWGVVNGSLTALEHLRQHGGTIINIGSVLGDRAIPFQGMYCASKHAIKGFTDALRMETAYAELPVAITLIKPSAINTPVFTHAKNYMKQNLAYPPPVYDPEIVAGAILHCAQHIKREVSVGLTTAVMGAAAAVAPKTLGKGMEQWAKSLEQGDEPARPLDDNALYNPADDGQERGDYTGHVFTHSLTTSASLHPIVAMLTAGAAGLAIYAVFRTLRRA